MTPVATPKSIGNRRVSLAIVGCGALAELYYAPALKGLQGAEPIKVAALIDPNASRRAILSRSFPDARGLASVEELRPGEADLAIVASPQKFHAAQTIALLRAGLHVLCEKPMAASLEEARNMAATARETGRLLSVGLFRRFFPSSQMVKDLIDGGTLGRPVSFEWIEGGPFNWPAASPSLFQKASSPGGVFADIGAHVLDLLLWWFGEPLESSYEDDAMGGIESNCRLRLRFGHGVTGSVRLSRDIPIPNGTRLRFERGSVWFQGASADAVVLQLDGCHHLAKAALHEPPPVARGSAAGTGPPARTYPQCFMAQILNLCRAIRGEEALLVPGEQAVRGMELIEHCYRARRPMPMPWLEAEEQVVASRLQSAAQASCGSSERRPVV